MATKVCIPLSRTQTYTGRTAIENQSEKCRKKTFIEGFLNALPRDCRLISLVVSLSTKDWTP